MPVISMPYQTMTRCVMVSCFTLSSDFNTAWLPQLNGVFACLAFFAK